MTREALIEALNQDLAGEYQAVILYTTYAAAFGDKGLATHLETIVEDETAHYEETDKNLRGW